MMLPDIDELDLDFNQEETEAKKKKAPKETKKKKDKVEQKTEKDTGKRKPRIPKSEYDENGNPILMIPDLNDVALKDEINRFFGVKEG